MTRGIGGPYLYALWTDANLAPSSHGLAALGSFYNDVHLPEVLAGNPGFITAARVERTSPDTASEGFAAAHYAALYGAADEAAVVSYLERNVEGKGQPPHYSALPPYFPGALIGRGRALYERSDVAGDLTRQAHVAVLVDLSETGPRDLADAVTQHGFARASRYRLYRDLNGGTTSSPSEFDVYEADAASATDSVSRYRASTVANEADIVYDVLHAISAAPAAAQL